MLIQAQKSAIACITLSNDGSLVATSSVKVLSITYFVGELYKDFYLFNWRKADETNKRF
jgi:hypothetical protein